jgi:hypothetical protein
MIERGALMTNSPGSVPRQGGTGAQTTVFLPVPNATPAPKEHPEPPGGLGFVTLVVALLTLVVAIAGIVVAAVALGRSNDATTLARSANNRPAPPPPAPATATATPAPTTPGAEQSPAYGQPSDDPGDGPLAGIEPSAQFTTAYEGEPLRVRSAGCDSEEATQVDLDEPQVVGADTEHAELGYAGCSPGSVGSELAFAQVSGPDATPADCIGAIRSNPGQSPVAPAAGMTLCLVTSPETPDVDRKLVLLTIDAISQDDEGGILEATATAWNVPQ